VPVAFVIARPDVSLEPVALLTACREGLAGYKVPRHVWVVESLPVGDSGKLLKPLLRDDAIRRLGTV
jgi:acyl-CoA synthetase (AMP-forming)/AMP-acid ligase II